MPSIGVILVVRTLELKKFIIIFGHYGTGKTNFALNLARYLAAEGKTVTLADLDIVNPYFRSSDYMDKLEGVKVVMPVFAGTTLDLPSLPPELDALHIDTADHVIIDVGGDDAGATALGRIAGKLPGENRIVLYLINRYRPMISQPESAAVILREIEAAAGIRADALVNNTHISHYTVLNDILTGVEYAEKVSEVTGLPLLYTTVQENIYNFAQGRIPNPFPIHIIVKTPF